MSSLKALVCLTATFILQIQLAEKNFLRADASINDRVINLTASIGEKITLPCVFQENVNCEWRKNKSQFSPTARGIHLPKEQTKNCSITLKEIEQKDFTNWTCCSTRTTENKVKIRSEIWLSQKSEILAIPKPSIFPIGIEGTDTLTLEELVKKDISCSSKHGNPAPTLYCKLDGKRIAGAMQQISNGENNYTTNLKWNTSLDCEHIKLTNAALECCAENPGLDDDCDSIPLKQYSVRPTITLNGRNVSNHQINFTAEANSLQNLTCVLPLSVPCEDPNIAFRMIWIVDGKPITGLIENGSNHEQTLAWNSCIVLSQNITKNELQCRVTPYSNPNYSLTASVYLLRDETGIGVSRIDNHWTGSDSLQSFEINGLTLIAFSIIVIIIVAFEVLYFRIMKKCPTTSPKIHRIDVAAGVGNTQTGIEPIYEDVDYTRTLHQTTDSCGYLMPLSKISS